MPFRLSNAPAAFQRFMNDIFGNLLDVCVIVYLDDILIYSDDMSQHRKHVKEVLRRLRKHGLYTKARKCEFHRNSVEYLGYILTYDGLRMAKDKVQTILDWPELWKVKDIQSFLGFANFYHQFIYGYSEITTPLTRLMQKNASWNFDSKCRAAFNKLKEEFTHAPLLTHWVPNSQIVVETDTLDYALTTILSIHSSDGEIHPITFHSHSFNPAELNYDTHDKELLAIFEAFKHWCQYLEGSGTPVDMVTDHKNLEYFATTKLLTRCQARWSEFLSQFNMIIQFRPRKLGTKPDALTRCWDIYRKGGNSNFTLANLSNLQPIFTQEQLSASLCRTVLATPIVRNAIIIDIQQLHNDIRSSLTLDPLSSTHLPTPTAPNWTLNDSGLLCHHDRIYIPDMNDL
jgi:hypothetical protein